jgi:DNA modification methylase
MYRPVLWQLKRITLKLYQGDCLEVMKSMADKSIDTIITDIPYGTTACAWDEVIPFDLMWNEVNRICKGAIILFSAQPFTSKLIMSNYKNYKFGYIWNKKLAGNALNSNYQPLKIHEDICIFSNNGYKYNPIMKKGAWHSGDRERQWDSTFGKQVMPKKERYNTYKPTSIIQFHQVRSGRVHPTQKPVELLEYLVLTYSDKGDSVLDFTMGSGTTGIACVITDRDFIGIEIDKTYFGIAEKRIAEARQQMRLPV